MYSLSSGPSRTDSGGAQSTSGMFNIVQGGQGLDWKMIGIVGIAVVAVMWVINK
jgi:hypothetical protein